jgi:GNAT superfamily N-acetyltransferase
LHELSKKFMGELEIVFPTEWNRQSFSLFHGMEESGFRQELQYSFKELMKSLENPELVFWLITEDGAPQILLFGYAIPDGQTKSFYLDTFAVRRRGEGIGDIVMEFLIRWAKTKQYRAIVLDTELKDEKGFPLQHFYAEHGFKTVSRSKNDVKMKRILQ